MLNHDQRPIIVHVVFNNFTNDSRVLREAAAAKEFYPDYDVVIIALHREGLSEFEYTDSGLPVYRIKRTLDRLHKFGFLFYFKYIEWIIRSKNLFKDRNVYLVHCHDILALPVGVLLKKAKKARVVYDAHELTAHQYTKKWFKKRMKLSIEKSMIRKADSMITVSEGIMKWYKEHYKLSKINVVRNIPEYDPGHMYDAQLRTDCGIPSEALVFGYVGGLSESRLIREILSAFHNVERDCYLVFLGSGKLRDEVMAFSKKDIRIRYHPSVPSMDVVQYTRGMDVGFALSNTAFLNSRLSMPNKLFQYIEAGVPFVVARGTSREEYIFDKDIGWAIDIGNISSIINFIANLDEDELLRKKRNIKKYCGQESWDKERMIIKRVYELAIQED